MSRSRGRDNLICVIAFGVAAVMSVLLLAGCAAPKHDSPPNPSVPLPNRQASVPASESVIATISVDAGSMLARDVIPQLAQAFSLPSEQVKSELSSARSGLIGGRETGFRRMEGLIPPGDYAVRTGTSLSELVSQWVSDSERRYELVSASTTASNGLDGAQQLALASVVEAECLDGKHQSEVATVFLNRLATHSKLQSCATAEYALGYQRPYLLYKDVAVDSKYNTYVASGLPAGPICSVSDAALKAAVSKPLKSDIRYFYYDYVLNDLFFFSDYGKFRASGAVARNRFERTSKVGAHDKVNKQELY